MYFKKIVSDNGTKVYRSVSDEEAEKLKETGEDVLSEEEMNTEEKQKLFFSKTEADSRRSIIRMLPFLEDEEISKMVDKMLDGKWDMPFDESAVYPFASDEDMDRLFLHRLADCNESTAKLAPFVSKGALTKGVELVIEGKIHLSAFDTLYPFLDDKELKLLFEYALKRKQNM